MVAGRLLAVRRRAPLRGVQIALTVLLPLQESYEKREREEDKDIKTVGSIVGGHGRVGGIEVGCDADVLYT